MMDTEEQNAYYERRAAEDESVHITKEYVCAVCAGQLSTPFLYDKSKEISIVCGTDSSHEGTVKLKSWYRKWNQGDPVPVFIANNLEKKYGRAPMNKITTELMVSEQDKLALTEQLTELLGGFQDKDDDGNKVPIKPVEITRAIALVKQGFDPYNHLVVYHGKVSLNRDGVNWWANKTGISHRVVCKPVPSEQRDDYGVKTNEIGVIAELFIKDEVNPRYSALGRASKVKGSEVIYKSKVEAQHPFDLAQKRAEVKVVKKWRPINAMASDEYEEAEELGEPIVEDIVVTEVAAAETEEPKELGPGAAGFTDFVEDEPLWPKKSTPLATPALTGVVVVVDPREESWAKIKVLLLEKEIADARIKAWFKEAYDMSIGLSHFRYEKAPEEFTPEILGKLLIVLGKARLPDKQEEIPF